MRNGEKFIKFLQGFDMDPVLLESVLRGYEAVFLEGINAWAASGSPFMPFVNPIRPMGEPVFDKYVTSTPGGLGGAGDATTNSSYQYGAALPGSTRDIAEETIADDWSKDLPKLPAVKKATSKPVKNIINKAHEHIPNVGDNMVAPINYYTNFHMGMYDIDTRPAPF